MVDVDKELGRTPENGWETNEEYCPHCNASLQGGHLDEQHLHHKDGCTSEETGERCFCLPYGKVTHFSRKMGHEVPGVYDGILFWSCPDCGGTWHRWTDPSMRARAEKFIHGPEGET